MASEASVMPTKEQAGQLALMIVSGMPLRDCLTYFFPDAEEADLVTTEKLWRKSPYLSQEIRKLQGKAWQEMDLDERIKLSIDKHYAEAAYYLYSRNYATLQGNEKLKADTCRQVLEAKLAGMSGKMAPMERWLDDVRKGLIHVDGMPQKKIVAN